MTSPTVELQNAKKQGGSNVENILAAIKSEISARYPKGCPGLRAPFRHEDCQDGKECKLTSLFSVKMKQ